jgi:hypothetical protein
MRRRTRLGPETVQDVRSSAVVRVGGIASTLTESWAAMSSDPSQVAEQAGLVAAAWSPVGAPASWALTAALFEALRDDDELLALAATIPADRLPPLLFTAAATFLVLELSPEPLHDSFPRLGEPQPPLAPRFRDEYRRFCLEHGDRLLTLCAEHRYQMNEVGRCADLLPALAPAIAEDRALALVDIGTGAGLALHLDRYRYAFRGPADRITTLGEERSAVVIDTEVRGSQAVPLPPRLPRIAARIGIDIEPLDLADRTVRDWLYACLPQEIGAVTRFDRAARVALEHPVPTVRGDACDVLPEVLASIPEDLLVCLLDTYVHVFFDAERLRRFRGLIDEVGATRDLDWISLDPLVPMGQSATDTVIGVPATHPLIERQRRGAVFGALARLGYRGGARSESLLAFAHPGAAWIEWL